MADIEFSPNSAPLSGATTPSIDDINSLTNTSERVVWRPPLPTPSQVKRAGWALPISLLAGLFVYGALLLIPAETSSPRSISAGSPVVPDLTTAKVVYAVIKKPSKDDFETLANAASAGVKVTLICPKNTQKPDEAQKVAMFPTDETDIISEGYLLNGFQWYPRPQRAALLDFIGPAGH